AGRPALAVAVPGHRAAPSPFTRRDVDSPTARGCRSRRAISVRGGGGTNVRRPGGAQVAAEAMPYIKRRSADCKTGRPAIRCRRDAPVDVPRPAAAPRAGAHPPGLGPVRPATVTAEVAPFGVEYLIRTARITDVDRLAALCELAPRSSDSSSPMNASDLLR